MKNLISKIKSNFRVLFTFALAFFFLFSCEIIEPCERDGFGWAEIHNATGGQLWVDCTEASSGENQERLLSNGSSHEYQMDEGTVYVWGRKYGYDKWYYDTYTLDACEEFTYTWYSANKKSTGFNLYLDITDANGDLVLRLDNFQLGEK